MASITWGTPGSLTTLLDTSLNSLGNNTTDLSGAIDNTSNKHMYMDLQLNLASLDLSAQSNPSVEIYLIPSLDETNYDTADDAVSANASYPPADQLLCIFGLRLGTGAEAKQETKCCIVIPPRLFKLVLINKTGVAFAASSNTLKYSTYGVSSA